MENKCSGYVSLGRMGIGHCHNKPKVERNGKWYCGVHDPEKPLTKSQIASNERYRKRGLMYERRELEKSACANLTNEQLKDMADKVSSP